jgi:GT2 family glycosyltransferase
MVHVDVIILTKSMGQHSITMTKRTMLSMQQAESNYKFHFHLVESGMNIKSQYAQIVDNYIVTRGDFNYNKSINNALKYVKHDWVIISNNDVGYEKNWFTEIMDVHKLRPDIESFSPKEPMLYLSYFDWHFIDGDDKYFESYKVSEALMGWSLVIKKTALDKIIPFDEQFDMYYQDNDYAMMLQKNNIKHALVRHSIACHLATLKNYKNNDTDKQKKMDEDFLKFTKKWYI